MEFTIAGFSIAALTLGITQGVKSIFDIKGKTNQIIAIIVGFVLTSLAQGISNSLIPVNAIPYIEWLIISIGGGLSAIGVFDFIKSEILNK